MIIVWFSLLKLKKKQNLISKSINSTNNWAILIFFKHEWKHFIQLDSLLSETFLINFAKMNRNWKYYWVVYDRKYAIALTRKSFLDYLDCDNLFLTILIVTIFFWLFWLWQFFFLWKFFFNSLNLKIFSKLFVCWFILTFDNVYEIWKKRSFDINNQWFCYIYMTHCVSFYKSKFYSFILRWVKKIEIVRKINLTKKIHSTLCFF